MERVPLTGGAYSARSLIAGAQKCLNLFAEAAPPEQKEPAPVAHYPTPGLTLLNSPSGQSGWRCLYRSKGGQLYGVCGTAVYLVNPDWTFRRLGSIAAGTSRVSMSDNGVLLAIVDGTTAGYAVDIASGAWAPIYDPGFYGADTVDYCGTYFIFSRPGLPQYYVSDSNALTFDALYFANMAGYQDPLMGLAQVRGTFALIGQTHTEWWSLSGAADFPFQAIPTASLEHGCCAKYSIAKADNAIFWLSQDEQGQGIAMLARGYAVDRISTHAIEAEWQGYATITDAIGYTRQQAGHEFYVLTFPTADRTWVYDLATKLWHEWGAFDGTTQHRHRGQVGAFAYGKFVVGDYATGALYAVDPTNHTDAGTQVYCQRSFPHMMNDGKRVFYTQLIADMQCGAVADGSQLTLDWSDDRGATFSGTQTATLNGDTLTSLQFQRLGMARDRIFRFTFPSTNTALQGAFIDMRVSGS